MGDISLARGLLEDGHGGVFSCEESTCHVPVRFYFNREEPVPCTTIWSLLPIRLSSKEDFAVRCTSPLVTSNLCSNGEGNGYLPPPPIFA